MGIGFVILFHLIAIFILSFIIGIIAVIIVSFILDKQKRTRKLFFAFCAPFIGFYTLYICAFIGSTIISQTKGIDIGIGDTWYVPLNNSYKLLFIDIPDYGSISDKNTGEIFLSDISEIEQRNDLIFGKMSSDEYFLFNTETRELSKFESEKGLTSSSGNQKLSLKNVYDFYSERKSEARGYWFYLIGILSLLFSIGHLWIVNYIILFFSFSKRLIKLK
ncbi:hypothetical protein [Chryseobacterium sp.]|uniref:hypothetical protein n=1 Tax=Chryseobacterium sp. TaxID=1871047 RepID=UPI0012C1EAA5|nr:hypothetical protein [Chryseobacterium sp.]MPS63347.1 hypothetical protein [Chryseobacterium sp.]